MGFTANINPNKRIKKGNRTHLRSEKGSLQIDKDEIFGPEKGVILAEMSYIDGIKIYLTEIK